MSTQISEQTIQFSFSDVLSDGDPVNNLQELRSLIKPVLDNIYKDPDFVDSVLKNSFNFLLIGYDSRSDGDMYSVVIESFGSVGYSNGILTE